MLGFFNGGPWPNYDNHGAEITTLPANAFTEVGVDLTNVLGSSLCISTFIGKTRSSGSGSFTSELKDYAHERLSHLNWLKIYGQARDKGAIVSFNIDGLHPHDISTIIDRSGVAVRAGHHCAQPLMDRLGVTATCRASFAMYNTKDEVDSFARALVKAQEIFA